MADMFTARPVSAAMGLGLRVPSAGFNADPAMQSGLGSLRPTRADTAMVGTVVPPSPEQSIGGLRAGAAQQVEGLMSLPPLEQRATARPPATVYFNQATNEMFAGDRAFKADDATSALQAAQQPGNTTRPQGQGWAALPEGSFNDYIASFSERRGKGELLGLGARQLAEGTIGGIGTLMEFGGATEAGPAVREFAQGVFGQDQNEQLRAALIAENSTLMQKIIDGAWQAIPTIASVVTGGGLAGLGARALGAGATGIRAAATAGGAGSTFPMHVSSYFDAAVRNGLDPNDPEIKTEILGGAFANTALDVLGISAASGKIISRALRQTVEESGKKAARSALRNGLTGAALTGFGEGLTETLQTLGETALFDPTVRDQWAAGDWKAMAPYLSETYGDDYLVAAGVGAVLGGGMGGVANFRGTPGPAAPQPEIDQTKPVDLNTTATGQSAEKEAPAPLGEVQGLGPVVPNLSPEETALAADWQSDAALGPAVPSLGESEQALADQWRSTLGPLQLAPGQRVQPAPAAGTPMGALLLRPDQRVQPAATAPQPPLVLRPSERVGGGPLVLAPSQRVQPAATTPQPPLVLRPSERVGGGPLVLAPSQRVQPAPAAGTPMGQALLTQRQRTDVPPTVSMMAPVVEARPGALLLRGNQRAVPAAPLREAQGPLREAQGPLREAQGPLREAQGPLREMQGPKPLTKARKAAATKKPTKPKALTKAQQTAVKKAAVRERVAGLTDEQNVSLMDRLGVEDMAGVDAAIEANPDEVLKAVDEVTAPPPETTPPAKKTAAPKEATLKAGTTEKPAAAPKSKGPTGQAAPVVTPAPEVQTPAKTAAPVVETRRPNASEEFLAMAADRDNDGALRAYLEAQNKARAEWDAIPEGEAKDSAATNAEEMTYLEKLIPVEDKLGWFRAAIDTYNIDAPEPEAQTTAETPAAEVTAKEPTRVTKATSGLDFDYYVVELSNGKAVEVRIKDKVWVFRSDESPIEGDKLTGKTVGAAVAKMAGEGKLPGATSVFAEPKLKEKRQTVRDEQAVLDQETVEELAGMEKDLGKTADPMKDERLQAAKDLLTIINDTDIVLDIRERAQKILDSAVTPEQKAVAEAALAAELVTERGTKETAKQVDMPKPVADLIALIRAYNSGAGGAFSQGDRFSTLAGVVAKDHPNALYDGRPLKAYFNEKFRPTFGTVDGVRRIVPAPVAGAPASGVNALADFNTLVGATGYDGKPVTPMATGRVQLLMRNFASKLARPPKMTVARNQADLKAKNPALYARAKAARGTGDFDTADAMGYSFGDGEVIVFSDRIATEQQLNFVLAHETLGHYGLRAIMPASKFEGVMDAVYNSNSLIKANVDMTVAVRGMSRAEATEEYLADYAAVLDMSVLRRVAAAMKNGLNALGFKFSDDMVRHLVRTARRYVRNGKRDNMFTASGVFRDIHDIESGADSLATGRFKEGFRSDNLRTDLLVYDVFGGPPRSVEQATAAIKEASSQLSARTEKFVNKFFSLTMFRAQENAGLSALVRIIMRSGEIAAAVRNRADEIMRFALNREVRILGVRVMGGITADEQVAAGYLMYTQQDNARGKVDAKVEATLKKLREAKKPTRMFSIIDGEVKDNTDAIEAYKAAGRLSLPEAKAILAADSRYKGIADKLDKDHSTWKAYEAGREAFEETELEFVKAQYKALIEDRGNAEMSMLDMLADPGPGKEKELLPQERAMFRTWTELYYALYAGGAVTVEDNLIATETGRGEAERFSKAVNEVILAKGFDTKKEAAVRKFFTGKRVDDFIGQLVDFRQRITRTTENEFAAQNAVAEFAAAEMSFTSAETSARKMLVQGYTPIVRKQQGFQIRVNAFDAETGAFVQMDTEHKGLAVYRTAGSVEEVTTLANQMNGQFADTENIPEGATDVEIATVDGKPVRTYKMKVRGKGEIDFKERRVIIRAEASAAVTGVTTPLNLNINEFLRGLRQYGLNVTPTKLEQIVIDMSAQDAKARKRLEQTGNPGYQVEGGVTALEAIAQHVDGRASLISKIQMRPLIDRLMNIKLSESQKLWFGDKQKLDALKKAYDAAEADPNANEAARFLAKAEYTDYAAKMKHTITTKNGVEVNLGNKYLSEAQDLMAFVNGNKDVNESDWGSGPVASWFRRWISSVQLGGTLAQPIMNNVGPFTNFLPWLMSYNAKNGFGGGAGFKNAYMQYIQAMSDVGSSGGMSFSKQAVEMHTAGYWDQVATGLREHPGVTKFEAEFIANETRNGVLTPAQANSLLGHSRNYTTNPAVRQALDKWMFFYISSEQATRRAAALAAFRVQVTRQLDAKGLKIENLTDAQRRTIYAKASTFATDGVRVTLGEYGVVNRPAAWRSGFQSFLYMYRVWQTTSIQTFNRLDAHGKAAFLIPLLALSGLAGLPFAEDLEDVLDTLMQRLGMTTGSVRLEAARLIDEVMPGMSPYILNGALTKVIGADVAGRFSMGDFAPGTAALLPGQDPFQTFKEVVGPAWGFLEGTLKGSSQLVAAPFSETATVVDAMREGPVTLLRALGDTMAYASTGAVIDKRGYVIEDDLTTTMLAIRILGFTPGSVAAQYEVIRLAKRETNYQKQVVAKFRTQLLKAEMRGDRVTAASIRRSVKEWNAVEKGTLLEIRDFEKNYQRLKKQALMPAKQRFMQSAGKANQDAIELIDQLASYD